MKNLLLLSIGIFCCLISVSQWTNINSPTDLQISGVSFVSNDIGYIGGSEGIIYKTEDGGENWTPQVSGITANIFSMTFTDEMNGHAAAGDGTGYILRTTDGGENWTSQSFATSDYLLEIIFTNSTTGYCVGYDGTILKTIDQGETWTAPDQSFSGNIRSIYFTNDTTGYAVSEADVIYKTIDAGETWSTHDSGTSSILLAIFFADEMNGFAAGGSGALVRTEDAGETWSVSESSTNQFLQCGIFTNSEVGYAFGGFGVIINTDDGGETWTEQYAGDFSAQYGWYGVNFINNTGYAVGYEGNIVSTSCVPSTGTDTQLACDSLSWIDGNVYYESNNSATYSLINTEGCDSIVTLDLTISQSTFATDQITACDEYTWIDGVNYTNSNNTAQFILTNAAECDSVITLDLTIQSVDVAVTDNSPTLVADMDNAVYQWVDCDDNYAVIPNETNQSFTATSTGNYAVIVTVGECSDTSSCFSVVVTNIEASVANQFILNPYPNPFESEISISYQLTGSESFATLSLMNTLGELIYSLGVNGSSSVEVVDLSYLAAGMYILRISGAKETLTSTIIKNN
jgi:photosystem II stability/assembly factor-like uncharacterized protein